MADSWGKLSSGILSGNLVNFGNFDQCIKNEHNFNGGKYCLLTIKLRDNINNDTTNNELLNSNQTIFSNFIKQNKNEIEKLDYMRYGLHIIMHLLFPKKFLIKNFYTSLFQT